MRPTCLRVPALRCPFTPAFRRLIVRSSAAHLSLIAAFTATALLLIGADPAAAAGSVPSGAKDALAPVTKMIGTLIAIAIGLGIAICGAVIVWGGIEKKLAGANTEAEHKAQKRIANGIMGLVWMVLAGVIVSTITAIAVAYGLIERPF
jgi:small-conductance mechanosensitive channel